MAVSGDIIEITCNHPTLGAFSFSPKAGEASTWDLGGFTSDDDQAAITGNGTMIDKMTRKRATMECPVLWDMNTTKDLENAQKLQNNPVPGDWTFSHINGTVYGLTGKPVGTLQGDGGAGTFTLKVSGPIMSQI